MDSNQKKATKVPLTESLESAGTSAPAAGETIAPKSGKPVASSEGDRVAAEPAIDKNSGGAVRQKFWHRMRESKNLYLWILFFWLELELISLSIGKTNLANPVKRPIL